MTTINDGWRLTYTKKGKRRAKCYECGKLIADGEQAVGRQVASEKYYPVKGIMRFNKWQFRHADCSTARKVTRRQPTTKVRVTKMEMARWIYAAQTGLPTVDEVEKDSNAAKYIARDHTKDELVPKYEQAREQVAKNVELCARTRIVTDPCATGAMQKYGFLVSFKAVRLQRYNSRMHGRRGAALGWENVQIIHRQACYIIKVNEWYGPLPNWK